MRWLKHTALASLAIALTIALSIGFFLYQAYAPYSQFADSWVFQPPSEPVIGDLGGIPVSIPRHVARFVEYQDDPHFLEPRNNPMPVRTFKSKLRSFGFEVRFPDMALVHDETPEQMRNIYPLNTMWLTVGIDTDPYRDALPLNHLVETIPWPGKIWSVERMGPDMPARTWTEQHGYIRSQQLLNDLVVMEVTGYDNAKRYQMPGNDFGDQNIYYHITNQGIVDSYK